MIETPKVDWLALAPVLLATVLVVLDLAGTFIFALSGGMAGIEGPKWWKASSSRSRPPAACSS